MEDGLWASCWIAFWTSTTSRRPGTWRAAGARRQALRGELAASFEKRARRPPPDPVNSLLGLGYTLLTEAMMTALEVAGLDPYIGFFHADKYGRPALALDLIEEFRAPVVDSLVLTLVNKRMVGPEDFEEGKEGTEGETGVYLNQQGRRVFFREFADRLESETLHPLAGRRLSYRKIFEVQARQAAKVISGEAEAYRAFVWR
jgi:CRISPR-associated protein Cas1